MVVLELEHSNVFNGDVANYAPIGQTICSKAMVMCLINVLKIPVST